MSEVKLPEGWCRASLGDYIYLKNGFAFKSTSYVEPSEKTHPVIRISDLDGSKASDNKAVHTKEEIDGFNINHGDLLIAMSGATTGKTGIYTGKKPAYQNQRVGNIILHSEKNGDRKYRNYLILSLSKKILDIAYGGAQPNISSGSIERINILFPPLHEQKIIADKLDTLLSQVDSIKAHLDQIPLILKKFRQSVLAAAVSGKLTEGWRDENKKTIAQWSNQKIKDIVSHIEAGKNIKCIEHPPGDGELGVVKISAVTWGKYNEEESKTLFEKSHFIESRRINTGDFLISRANTLELLGAPVIVYKTTKSLMLSDKVLRLVMDDFQKPWVSIFLKSQMGRKEIESRSTGNQLSMRNIGQKALLDIAIPKPPLEEQTEIVRRVEQLFAYADGVEKQVQNALERVNNLTQSILAKAFRGELTAQWRAENPELISGENSAEALLARIKAERAAQQPQKKTRQKASTTS
ncbi:restriction endonuclease subunit S [Dickeya undicola]|uniref:restriction endonuclease subunit S n=1 Tax=Dickeya undicola TaxID=1577887 RepID=UPI003F285B42